MVGFARAGLGLEVVWAGVRELSGVARVFARRVKVSTSFSPSSFC